MIMPRPPGVNIESKLILFLVHNQMDPGLIMKDPPLLSEETQTPTSSLRELHLQISLYWPLECLQKTHTQALWFPLYLSLCLASFKR